MQTNILVGRMRDWVGGERTLLQCFLPHYLLPKLNRLHPRSYGRLPSLLGKGTMKCPIFQTFLFVDASFDVKRM